jgi:hypothetical protein
VDEYGRDQEFIIKQVEERLKTDEKLRALAPDELDVDQPKGLARRIGNAFKKIQERRFGPEGRHVKKAGKTREGKGRWILRKA